MQVIYLAGGCFWCTEAIFRSIRGINEVVPGYMNGTLPSPSYEAVCSGTTGHAEAVRVVYDEHVISLADILDIFFETHDPTMLNRQGNDVGTQYRSAIFYPDEGSRKIAVLALARAQALRSEVPIVTEITKADTFYPAEDYHQEYYKRNKNTSYCALVISPKLEKLQKKFQQFVQ